MTAKTDDKATKPGRPVAPRSYRPGWDTTEVVEWRREDHWRASDALARVAAAIERGDDLPGSRA